MLRAPPPSTTPTSTPPPPKAKKQYPKDNTGQIRVIFRNIKAIHCIALIHDFAYVFICLFFDPLDYYSLISSVDNKEFLKRNLLICQ